MVLLSCFPEVPSLGQKLIYIALHDLCLIIYEVFPRDVRGAWHEQPAIFRLKVVVFEFPAGAERIMIPALDRRAMG
jgi:hypothetical protein